MVPMALMGAGVALQLVGQWSANMSRAQAETQNAKYYEEEAQYARFSQYRQAQITAQNYAYKISLQGSAAAKGGVDVGSGSILNTLAETAANQVLELNAVKRKGDLDYELANARSEQANDQAGTYGSLSYNLFQAGGTALTSYASYTAKTS